MAQPDLVTLIPIRCSWMILEEGTHIQTKHKHMHTQKPTTHNHTHAFILSHTPTPTHTQMMEEAYAYANTSMRTLTHPSVWYPSFPFAAAR